MQRGVRERQSETETEAETEAHRGEEETKARGACFVCRCALMMGRDSAQTANKSWKRRRQRPKREKRSVGESRQQQTSAVHRDRDTDTGTDRASASRTHKTLVVVCPPFLCWCLGKCFYSAWSFKLKATTWSCLSAVSTVTNTSFSPASTASLICLARSSSAGRPMSSRVSPSSLIS